MLVMICVVTSLAELSLCYVQFAVSIDCNLKGATASSLLLASNVLSTLMEFNPLNASGGGPYC